MCDPRACLLVISPAPSPYVVLLARAITCGKREDIYQPVTNTRWTSPSCACSAMC
jgi:hypothetical protein